MLDKEKILIYMKSQGPILPTQVSKQINKNILMSSAILSEMASNKEVRISSIKVGGSPLYYLDGQESMLQDYSSKLQAKDRQTYDLIRERKVLREKVLDPVTKLSLRNIKDFAQPLQVTLNNEKEIFWKWYLTSQPEAE